MSWFTSKPDMSEHGLCNDILPDPPLAIIFQNLNFEKTLSSMKCMIINRYFLAL